MDGRIIISGEYTSQKDEPLEGKIITEIVQSPEEILFIFNDGRKAKMYHQQDCCESVYIEDIAGDLDDLLNTPILKANEDTSTNEDDEEDIYEHSTWTFYNISTIKGSVTIRWFGCSNGYYSESVDCCWEENEQKGTGE